MLLIFIKWIYCSDQTLPTIELNRISYPNNDSVASKVFSNSSETKIRRKKVIQKPKKDIPESESHNIGDAPLEVKKVRERRKKIKFVDYSNSGTSNDSLFQARKIEFIDSEQSNSNSFTKTPKRQVNSKQKKILKNEKTPNPQQESKKECSNSQKKKPVKRQSKGTSNSNKSLTSPKKIRKVSTKTQDTSKNMRLSNSISEYENLTQTHLSDPFHSKIRSVFTQNIDKPSNITMKNSQSMLDSNSPLDNSKFLANDSEGRSHIESMPEYQITMQNVKQTNKNIKNSDFPLPTQTENQTGNTSIISHELVNKSNQEQKSMANNNDTRFSYSLHQLGRIHQAKSQQAYIDFQNRSLPQNNEFQHNNQIEFAYPSQSKNPQYCQLPNNSYYCPSQKNQQCGSFRNIPNQMQNNVPNVQQVVHVQSNLNNGKTQNNMFSSTIQSTSFNNPNLTDSPVSLFSTDSERNTPSTCSVQQCSSVADVSSVDQRASISRENISNDSQNIPVRENYQNVPVIVQDQNDSAQPSRINNSVQGNALSLFSTPAVTQIPPNAQTQPVQVFSSAGQVQNYFNSTIETQNSMQNMPNQMPNIQNAPTESRNPHNNPSQVASSITRQVFEYNAASNTATVLQDGQTASQPSSHIPSSINADNSLINSNNIQHKISKNTLFPNISNSQIPPVNSSCAASVPVHAEMHSGNIQIPQQNINNSQKGGMQLVPVNGDGVPVMSKLGPVSFDHHAQEASASEMIQNSLDLTPSMLTNHIHVKIRTSFTIQNLQYIFIQKRMRVFGEPSNIMTEFQNYVTAFDVELNTLMRNFTTRITYVIDEYNSLNSLFNNTPELIFTIASCRKVLLTYFSSYLSYSTQVEKVKKIFLQLDLAFSSINLLHHYLYSVIPSNDNEVLLWYFGIIKECTKFIHNYKVCLNNTHKFFFNSFELIKQAFINPDVHTPHTSLDASVRRLLSAVTVSKNILTFHKLNDLKNEFSDTALLPNPESSPFKQEYLFKNALQKLLHSISVDMQFDLNILFREIDFFHTFLINVKDELINPLLLLNGPRLDRL